MLLTSIISLLALASSVSAYPTTAVLKCRSGPGTSNKVIKTYAKGTDLKLTCQIKGEVIDGNALWDKTSDNCYVSDRYVKTGTNAMVVKSCSSGGGGGGGGSTSSNSYCKGINEAGITLIKDFEGFIGSVYRDPVGKETIGFGHLCQKKGCAEVKYKQPLTRDGTGEQLLKDDIPNYTSCLGQNIKVKLNDNQWAALTSFVFNLGCGSLRESSLLRRLNAGENPNTVAAQEIPKWNHAGGSVLPGLTRRRNAEVALFKKPSSKQANPKCT